jgi:FolB domain-containing protein
MTDLDSIRLIGAECRARLGVSESERRKPQRILLDIELELPLLKAGRSDDVSDTVNYWAVEKEARRIAETGEYRLAERLTQKIAESLLRLDRRVRCVRVAVHKRPAVMPNTREVIVSIVRQRI